METHTFARVRCAVVVVVGDITAADRRVRVPGERDPHCSHTLMIIPTLERLYQAGSVQARTPHFITHVSRVVALAIIMVA